VMPAFLVWGKGSRFPNGQRFTDFRPALQSPFMAAFDQLRTLGFAVLTDSIWQEHRRFRPPVR
jgi:hypothetical protein